MQYLARRVSPSWETVLGRGRDGEGKMKKGKELA
jgi:hypothetical protein